MDKDRCDKEKVEKITKIYPTPFHLYDEKESEKM